MTRLLDWFAKHRRPMPWRDTPTPYKVWISEIMLQQTQVATVIPYFERFVRQFPDVYHLAHADTEDVLRLWEGLGYYSRARRLPLAARQIEHDGRFPMTAAEWRQIPGVGDYTAAAIASIVSGEAVPAIDGNVLRVFTRVRGITEPVNAPAVRERIRAYLRPHIRKADPSAFNQAMMELGALICRPKKPHCEECPLQRHCIAYRHDISGTIPCKAPKLTVPRYEEALAVIRCAQRVLVCRRPEGGLLGGLWEFPGARCHTGETPRQALRRGIPEKTGLHISDIRKCGVVKHAFSHFSQTLHVYTCKTLHPDNLPSTRLSTEFRWCGPDELSRLPFSTAQRKVAASALGRDTTSGQPPTN